MTLQCVKSFTKQTGDDDEGDDMVSQKYEILLEQFFLYLSNGYIVSFHVNL